jgi:hypothetical protein
MNRRITRRESLAALFVLPAASTWRAPAQAPLTDDLTSIDSDGTAHIKLAVPVPKTISSDAYALMISGNDGHPSPERNKWQTSPRSFEGAVSLGRRERWGYDKESGGVQFRGLNSILKDPT